MGKRTVKTGINKIRFDGWGLSIGNTSFVLNMMVIDVKNRAHSRAIFVILAIPMSKVNIALVAGQNSCMSPVM